MHPRVSVNAVCSWQRSLADDVRAWQEHGITRVGIPLSKYEADPHAATLVAEAGLEIDSMIAGSVFTLGDPDAWPTEREALRRRIDVAASHRSRVLYVTTGPSRRGMTADESIDAFCQAVAPLIAPAQAAGVWLAVEQNHSLAHDGGCIHTFADLVLVSERTGIGMDVELQNCWLEYGIADRLRASVASIALVQVSDFVVGTDRRMDRAVPGDGDIPLTVLIGALIDGGYAYTFDLEFLGPRIEAEGYDEAVARGLEWLERCLTGLLDPGSIAG